MSGVWILGSFVSLQLIGFVGQKVGEWVYGRVITTPQQRELNMLSEIQRDINHRFDQVLLRLDYQVFDADDGKTVVIEHRDTADGRSVFRNTFCG